MVSKDSLFQIFLISITRAGMLNVTAGSFSSREEEVKCELSENSEWVLSQQCQVLWLCSSGNPCRIISHVSCQWRAPGELLLQVSVPQGNSALPAPKDQLLLCARLTPRRVKEILIPQVPL